MQRQLGSERRQPKKLWSAPQENWVKVNVDGALADSGAAGIGVIIRDSRGTVLLSAWKSLQNGASAEEIEALACREGLHLAAEWIKKPTILESDCSTVIDYLARKKEQRASSLFTIQEALQEASKLPSVAFTYVGRVQNVIAHELAQLARRLDHSAVWRGRYPVCVEILVAQDVVPQID